MSIHYSPTTVTNGLVLSLDAGNSKSYPGSGTTWTDLSGNGNSVPMTNGAGYDGSSLIYNGTNQRTFFDLPSLKTASYTISVWFKQTKNHTGGDTTVIAGITDGVGWRYGTTIGFTSALIFGQGNGSNTSISTPISVGNWLHIVGTLSGSATNMYKNGILAASGTGNTSYVASNLFCIAHGGDGYALTAYFGGNIGQINFYSRALSAAEVLQNFSALRGRYGV